MAPLASPSKHRCRKSAIGPPPSGRVATLGRAGPRRPPDGRRPAAPWRRRPNSPVQSVWRPSGQEQTPAAWSNAHGLDLPERSMISPSWAQSCFSESYFATSEPSTK